MVEICLYSLSLVMPCQRELQLATTGYPIKSKAALIQILNTSMPI